MEAWLESSLSRLSDVRATVFGDFCLDAYWFLEQFELENSIETGLPVHRVRQQRYSLGGAGSVADNLIELGVGAVRAIGTAGHDIFGPALTGLLRSRGINIDGFEIADDWQTMVYAKPYIGDAEQSRIDLGAFNVIPQTLRDRLIDHLAVAVEVSDVIVVNQQIPQGISDSQTIKRINDIIAQHPRRIFLVDARHFAAEYNPAILKLNFEEAARFLQEPADGIHSQAKACEFVSRINARTGKPVFLTRGERGMIVCVGGKINVINGLQTSGRVDTVGAGDAVVATLAATLGSGQNPITAAKLANIAAMVTVSKLHQTGTASRTEILEAGREPNYIFEPELAESPRHAKKVLGTDIEIVGDIPSGLAIKHCIFDHDGTLSVLREGWEEIMEPVMVRAILGKQIDTADSDTYNRVQQMAREFIDRTTGIQTLVQMVGLVKLIHQAGFVPEDEILDEHEYKRIYNDELLKMVQVRTQRLASGELKPTDFQIANTGQMLSCLHARRVKLYLASGTDVADVIAEAKIMGYADLFEGRIYGAVGNVNVEAKKVVLKKIISENDLAGHEFATFGDGPVEMRETQRRGGLCIGVASDEVRRFGWNMNKRKRLIRAGAKILIPDFSQLSALLKVLQLA